MPRNGRGPGTVRHLRFARIRLANWRNFVRIEAALQRRVLLVGPNAAGKSNFLDVFRFLHDIVSVGGGLEEAVRKRQGLSKLRSLAARRVSDIVIDVDIASDAAGPLWTYELHLTQDKQQRPLIKRERVVRNGEELFARPDSSDRSDPERLRQTYLQQVNVNRDFREVADFFGSIRYLHIVPQLVREPDRSAGRRDDPYGGDFLEQVAATREQTLRARLKRIEQALQVAVPQLRELELVRDTRGTPHLRGRYEHWRPQGAWQSEDQFSDGTLRLLGLLWALLDGYGPLLLEEPELSLHPEVVRYVPQMLARMQRVTGRQVILSTHSVEMLSDEGLGLDEVLLLIPASEGTDIKSAKTFAEVEAILEGGGTLADAVLPITRPADARQLTLFGDRG